MANSLKIHYARRATLYSYLLLLTSFALNAYIHNVPWVAVLFTFLPIMIFWPGLRKSNNRTLIWLCFALCIYFFVVSGNAVTRGHWLDWLEGVLLILLFVAAFLVCRWQQVSGITNNTQSFPEGNNNG